MSEPGRKIVIKTGVNWETVAAYTTERAMEKARREILPDITVRSLRKERRQGVHQGVWEVVAKLLSYNAAVARKLAKTLNPSQRHIHEFDWENLEEHFGTMKKAKLLCC